jgi:hypothetical protein
MRYLRFSACVLLFSVPPHVGKSVYMCPSVDRRREKRMDLFVIHLSFLPHFSSQYNQHHFAFALRSDRERPGVHSSVTMRGFLGIPVILLAQWRFLSESALGYEIRPVSLTDEASRRKFLATATSAAIGATVFARPAQAVDIKVSPLAHTFVTATGTAKPVRENDATRFCTNAKVVYLFEGKDTNANLAGEMLDLTVKRKAGEGPGVTPGKVGVLSSKKAFADVAAGLGLDTTSKAESIDYVVATAKTMPEGDVLFVGPIPSAGVATDGKILADTAAGLGTFVGAKTGGGVISVLLDGPRQDVEFEAGGYPVSDLLWYSI